MFRYTRVQALEDGVLVDLTEWAKELGFVLPVACTAAVWQGYIVPPPGTRELGQSERGRAHDLLWMLRIAIQRQKAHGESSDSLLFEVVFLQSPDTSRQGQAPSQPCLPAGRHETVKPKSICGPGDHAEPVLTILLTDEE